MDRILVVLVWILSYGSNTQSAELDDPQFASLGRHFAGTPSLLVTLATKEEVIRMLLNNFQRELRQVSENTQKHHNAVTNYIDGQLNLIERWKIPGPNPLKY